jgi:hypothetical protein
MAEVDKTGWKSGQWNAYVPAGKDKEERRARLAEVPEQWRDGVRKHAEAVFALQVAHRRMQK